jgi:molybdopterin-guanine dinucleotide biosynthesis protein A
MKTAVEYLSEQLKDKLGHIVINQDWQLFEQLFQTAKKMELDQMNHAYQTGKNKKSNRIIN